MKPPIHEYFGENKPRPDLGRESVRSGVVFFAARILNMFVQVGTTILLARLLSPRDYGLVAMVFALVGFAPHLIDLGTTDATVQRKQITQVGISGLFWLKVAIAATLTLLLAGSGGFIADFYGEPELTQIAVVASLMFIVSALSAQHFALMRRAMQFRRMAVIEIASNVISSLAAIVMALAGWGYWALVAKPVLASLVGTLGAWISCPWLPSRPRYTREARELVTFGVGVTGFTVTDYAAQSADRIALGYLYGAGQLGYFQNALLLYNNLLSLFGQLHDVAVASLSKLRNDLDELKRSWAAALSSLTFFTMLAFAGLAVTGQDVIVMLLGEKWEPTGPLLCIFAVRGIVHVVERTLGWLHVAAGRSDRWTRWGLLSAVVQLAAVFAGLPFGPTGVAVAHTIATFCLFVPALAYAGQPLGIGARDVVRAVGPQTTAALLTVVVGLAVQRLFLDEVSQLARFLLSVPVCIAIYLAVVVGIFKVTRPIRLAFSLLRDFSPARLRRSS
ncbi:MAG TPA: lipopolysaccharide biosynthesis protein [Hyphomicrobiaceae bacterium]|nr:lipopolysaccharide biosynthesis protein [Hyphomicrobiaceae bacterium]